jgi:hypothetical protein
MLSLAILVASMVVLHADTAIVIGTAERDLTGDGQPEILRLVGVGRTADSLDVTLSIESAGRTVYRVRLAPMTRTVGFDRGRRMLSRAQYRKHLADFGKWFFGTAKFKRPPEFVKSWREQAPRRLAEIPNVIARDRDPATPADSIRAVATWNEIQESGVTLFEFSAGGDNVTAIGWSARDRRFYRLLECC